MGLGLGRIGGLGCTLNPTYSTRVCRHGAHNKVALDSDDSAAADAAQEKAKPR